MGDYNIIHVIANPAGTFHCVGRVPALLAYIYETEEDVRRAFVVGPGGGVGVVRAAAGRVRRGDRQRSPACASFALSIRRQRGASTLTLTGV